MKVSIELDKKTMELLEKIPYGERSKTIRKAIVMYLDDDSSRLKDLIGQANELKYQLARYNFVLDIKKAEMCYVGKPKQD
jgi:metal-responsive CopG/Arc/MetJ family transcriptional regulator